MTDTRPVWLTREQRDLLSECVWPPTPGNPLAQIVAAWDAAPADPFRAARAALSHPDWDNDPLEVNEHVRAVLRALGMPDA